MVLAVIPARFDSVRLPGKALADIGGRPMVVRVWERARGAVDRCVVATDDERIATACRDAGAEVVLTGPCASGTDRVAAAARSLGVAEDAVIVNVQGDEPLLAPGAIRAVAALVESGAEIGTAVAPLVDDPSDPARVKAVLAGDGTALYFSRQPIPTGGPFLLHVGLYAFRPDVLERISRLPPSLLEESERLEQLRWLEAGLRVRAARVDTPHPSVDTPADLLRVRALWARLTHPTPSSSPSRGALP